MPHCFECQKTVASKDDIKRCSGCKKSYYCSGACQLEAWRAGHFQTCAGSPQCVTAGRLQAIADSQAEMVEDRLPELRAILQRNFVIKAANRPSGLLPSQLSAGTVVPIDELVGLETYTLTWQDLDAEEPEEGTSSVWKWRGTETTKNLQDPTQSPRCPTFAEIVEALGEDKRYTQGKILYALGDHPNGYGLLLNWCRFGTVLPKYPYTKEDGCMQEDGEFVEEIEVQRKRWDDQISRAAKDLKDVPCMFLETPLGCHIKNCKLRHSEAVQLDEETQEWGEEERKG